MPDASRNPLRIVLLDRKTLPDDIHFRPFSFAHELIQFDQTAPDEVSERIKDADIVITNKAPVRGSAIASAPNLKLIAVAATGTDVVDVAACTQRGVTVSNIRNYAVNTVPEHTFALILALRRSVLAYRNSVRAGRWQDANQFCYFDFPINDLAGSTLGIIGDGALGRSVADLGRAFGMQVLFSDYKGSKGMGPLYTPFEKVLEASDIITLHSPLMPSTRNMISTAEFAQMGKRPLLINTARGGLVDEAALEHALRSGQISGAGFDVVTAEPPAHDHPLMRLLDLPNFILTPHVAWASREAVQSLVDQLIDNVEAFERGAPTNIVAA
ncbi:D-2-hydroxyacid dehydrogenase [Rhizobium laguerreae]|uniref:D-2-hydroxyacid dehydrogenase n=1 Tax=Rhizobiaceae TaxID=82115 RepID=UPI000C9A6E4E|nr:MULTISPECIES: D-2-hydroxyacid dehydrogenase [Rhizobiaceae]MBY3473689.1 D-2-hydroxyacid dehydrogenase [Rhizobium laguerreae]MBY3521695.1 D-2-hydroxyacid dehydrogenase [Rhizobium laguerreae]PND26028.1 glycerate dehydrogenase [Sinorhizobium sp. M4_45]